MAVSFERSDAHISHLTWEGKVSYEEIEQVRKEGQTYFESINELPAVLLIDMQKAHLTLDFQRIRGILRANDADVLGMVIVGTNAIAQLGAKVLENVFNQNIAYVKDLDEGLAKARAMRDDYFSK